MQQQILNLTAQLDGETSRNQAVQEMFNNGVLKQDDQGNIVPVLDPEESESIRSQYANASRRRPMTEAEIDQVNA